MLSLPGREQELVIKRADDNDLSGSLAVGMLVERAGANSPFFFHPGFRFSTPGCF